MSAKTGYLKQQIDSLAHDVTEHEKMVARLEKQRDEHRLFTVNTSASIREFRRDIFVLKRKIHLTNEDLATIKIAENEANELEEKVISSKNEFYLADAQIKDSRNTIRGLRNFIDDLSIRFLGIKKESNNNEPGRVA